jgi:hypothetical protein
MRRREKKSVASQWGMHLTLYFVGSADASLEARMRVALALPPCGGPPESHSLRI